MIEQHQKKMHQKHLPGPQVRSFLKLLRRELLLQARSLRSLTKTFVDLIDLAGVTTAILLQSNAGRLAAAGGGLLLV